MNFETIETAEYLLHVEELDRDHVKLFRLIDELQSAVRNGHESQAHAEAVERLEDYVRSHFDNESRLMRDCGLPSEAARAHEAEHQLFLGRIEQWRHELRAHVRSTTAVGNIVGFVRVWMMHHIQRKDAELATHVAMTRVGLR